MNRRHVFRFLQRRSLLLSLVTTVPIAVAMLGLTACVKHPVGDPEKSEVQERFSGVWLDTPAGDHGTLFVMQPYDARTYLVSIFSYQRKSGVLEPQTRSDWKSWLTEIDGSTFLTMQPLSIGHFAGIQDRPPYLVGKLRLVEDAIRLRFVDGQSAPANQANDRAELEAAIAEHLDSPSLYMDSETEFRKTTDAALVREILEAFHSSDW